MKIKNLTLSVIAAGFIGAALPVQANLQSELNSWFDNSGYTNVTAPGAYQSQIGGYYSGGSVSMRVPSRDVGVFASYQPPSFRGGCGGIDLDLGGFNLVNKDEIVQQLRAIGQNAKALAFSMAISYISSLLSSKMDYIKGVADKLNSMQMTSCDAAAKLMAMAGDGLTDQTNKETTQCIQRKIASSGLSYDQARTACTKDGDRDATNAGERNQRSFTEGNLAWFVMMNVPWLKRDLDTAEILMNMTGTTILYPKGTGNEKVKQPVPIPPMTGNVEWLLNYLVFGSEGDFRGRVMLYRCEDRTADEIGGCATLQNGGKPVEFDLSSYTPIKNKVLDRVRGIYSKVYDKDALMTNDERALIETVAAPIYKYILVSASAFRRTDPVGDYMLDDYLDGISKDMVATNLIAMLNEVKSHITMEKVNGGTDAMKQDYFKNLDNVVAQMRSVQENSIEKMNYIIAIQSEAQKYERVVAGRLSPGTLSASMFMR